MICVSPKADVQLTHSNLSKIKTKFRTSGAVSGNFGRAKVKVGSSLRDVGVSSAKVLSITTQDDYLNRMYKAFDITVDPTLKNCIFLEIRKILIQRGLW